MTHHMNLHPGPFAYIKSGRKTFELRLYDEKRRLIQVGDILIFAHADDATQTCAAEVKALHLFPDFDALYATLPLERCGYSPDEIATASPADMNVYYSEEKQARYGVVGIEIQLIQEEPQ